MKLKIITIFLCCFSLASAWSQTTVSGTVKDETSLPIIGANVIIKGTNQGVVTDFDGNYSITVQKGAVLSFSYIGFKDQDFTINSQSKLNVILQENSSELNEIIVVGYGKQKKESVLGAINSIKGTEILESGSPNLTNALSALSPGLNIVQSSGRPGADAGEIFIRGNANPLILVDGVEIVGGFSNIDTRDVESISTLKDGAATAVYGIRGANGVIIITTKRGKIGKPKISITSEFAIKSMASEADTMDAFTAQSALNVGILNDQNYLAGYSTPTDLAHWRDGDLPYIYPNTNWVDAATNKFTTSTNQNLSVQGGNEFVKYFASAGYLHEGDITKTEQLNNYDPTNKFDRYSFRANLDFTLTKSTRLKTSVSSRLENTQASGNNANINGNGIDFIGLYTTAPGSVVPYYPAEVMEQYPDALYPGLAEVRFGTGPNVYSALNNTGKSNFTNTVFSIDFELEQDLDFITKGLVFTGKYNYISNYETAKRVSFDTTIQARLDTYTLLRNGTWFAAEGRDYERPFEYIYGDESILSNQEIAYQRAQLFYDRSFGKHSVTGLALFSRNKKITNVAYPFYNEDWVGRATYNYDSRYFLELSGAYNGDETFAKGYRFKFFPSFAVGVNLAQEKFISENFPAVNNFKIRYSLGQTGDKTGLGSNRWQYLSYYDYYTTTADKRPGTRFWFGEDIDSPIVALAESQIGNEQLTWATVTKQNIGIDFGFLQNKFSGTVDFFKDNRDDLISRPSATIPAYFGSSVQLPYANLGASESHGYELSLTYKNRTGGGFNYSATAFYGFNENRITKSAADGPGTPGYTTVAGKPSGSTALLQTDGYFQNIDEVVNYPTFAGNPGLGDYRYIDYNANGTVIGNSLEDQIRFDLPASPKHSYSLRLSGSYKSWSISALLSGIEGHQGLIDSSIAYALPSGTASGIVDQLDYWTPTNTNAAYPALHTLNNPNLVSGTTARIVDLDYIKLRSANIGYDFNMANNKNISGFKLYLSGNNLLTFSKVNFGDPEGNNPGAYPILRRINLGLNMSF
ncbi:SusC/RagA family TonB-linked outer membrane protein [Flavobacterium algicola]|uniref:SusC/RagA family TonB-linked outer membrane protein n=1 Tax=Flavobacterium algicola TaxID=556529 RepID=UPI001EFD4961|nr:TonB-dependent receptor [Flavobacterium algicola]MCG9792288.1 TonB-dependent receptor [Flavobacterium algicola]